MVRHCLLFLFLLLLLPAAAAAQNTVAVSILGLQGELLNNVRALLSLERDKTDPRLTPAIIRRLHQRAPDEIRRALQPFGYYRPEIGAELQAPDGSRSIWVADYRIDPRDPVRLGSANIEIAGPGAGRQALESERQAFPLQPGDVLDHRRYEQGKTSLLQTARRLGFLDARLARHRIEVDMASYLARVAVTLETGLLYRFGPVEFEQEGFDQAYLRSFIPFRVGDPYTPEPLSQLRQALGATGDFERVDVERMPPPPEDPTLVPLRVQLKPNKPNVYRTRFGWGTDTGFGLHFDWNRRYLWDRGHEASLGSVLVQERSKLVLDLGYTIPLNPLEQTRLEFFVRHQGKDLSYEDVDLPVGGKTRILDNEIGVKWPRPRRQWGGLKLQERIGLGLLGENYDVFDVLFGHFSPFEQDLIETFLGDDREVLRPSFLALVPSVEWTLRRSDDPMYSRSGDFVNLSLKGALDGIGSNVSFWQARLRSVFIRPVAEADRLILRSDLAYTDAETIRVASLGNIAFNQLPDYYEFRTGGDRSVRGYGYETLLPDDSVTGGKHLVVASVEYEKALFSNWSAAAFLDVGNAFNEFSDLELKPGAGGGIRWRSPVGLVRLDLAVPLSEADSPFQVHLTVGPDF